MPPAPLLSMQTELREFVMQTQIRLTAVRQLITHAQQANKQTIGGRESLPPRVPPHSGTFAGDTAQQNHSQAKRATNSALCPVVKPDMVKPTPQDAAELYPTVTATERLESLKRRLAEQIQKD